MVRFAEDPPSSSSSHHAHSTSRYGREESKRPEVSDDVKDAFADLDLSETLVDQLEANISLTQLIQDEDSQPLPPPAIQEDWQATVRAPSTAFNLSEHNNSSDQQKHTSNDTALNQSHQNNKNHNQNSHPHDPSESTTASKINRGKKGGNRGSLDGTRRFRKVVTFRNSLVSFRTIDGRHTTRTRGRGSLLPWFSSNAKEHTAEVLAQQAEAKAAKEEEKAAKKAAKKAEKERSKAEKEAIKQAKEEAKKRTKHAKHHGLPKRSFPVNSSRSLGVSNRSNASRRRNEQQPSLDASGGELSQSCPDAFGHSRGRRMDHSSNNNNNNSEFLGSNLSSDSFGVDDNDEQDQTRKRTSSVTALIKGTVKRFSSRDKSPPAPPERRRQQRQGRRSPPPPPLMAATPTLQENGTEGVDPPLRRPPPPPQERRKDMEEIVEDEEHHFESELLQLPKENPPGYLPKKYNTPQTNLQDSMDISGVSFASTSDQPQQQQAKPRHRSSMRQFISKVTSTSSGSTKSTKKKSHSPPPPRQSFPTNRSRSPPRNRLPTGSHNSPNTTTSGSRSHTAAGLDDNRHGVDC